MQLVFSRQLVYPRHMNTVSHHNSIAVAVSGGADSLFSMLRLREQGRKVIALHGIFFKESVREMEEKKNEIRMRLAEACRSLDIPLTVVDLSQAFERQVIRPFVEEYARGRTPNPCSLCNARIKFGLLLDAARGLGATRLATGHYARLVGGDSLGLAHRQVLMQGKDELKDQSYFLALVPRDRLEQAEFPLGEAKKKDVLEALTRHGLEVPQPGESQEVCFIPDDEYRDFLPGAAEKLGIRLPGPGPMRLGDNTRVGTHQGLWRYTEGQRRGLGVAWTEPLHVLGKEAEGNVLRLGPRREMQVSEIICNDVNLLLPQELWPEKVCVKTRYRERPKPASAILIPGAGDALPRMRIRFWERENSAAPGQVAVVYISPEEKFQTPPSLADDERGISVNDDNLLVAAGGVIASSCR